MDQYQYDLFVIGAGSGGVRASRMASQYGAKVAVAENKSLGGTCVNAGCIPKKLFVIASHFHDEYAWAEGFGWTNNKPEFNWPTLKKNKNIEISRLNTIYEKLLESSKVDIIYGNAQLAGPHKVIVAEKEYTCDKILIATGGKPFIPDFPGNELAITSDDAFHLENLPDKIVVVGGGYIAIEFAGIFNGLGVETHLIYRGPLFLRGFDKDVREFIAEELKKKGIHLYFNTNVSSIEKLDKGLLKVNMNNNLCIEANDVLYATGRIPLTDSLGLETTRIRLNDNDAIPVNSTFETIEPDIFALGDVTGGHAQLTPIALAEAMMLTNHLFGDRKNKMNYTNIPTAVFCQPNIATVGLSEEQARVQYDNIDCYKSTFSPLKHTLSGSSEKTLVKVIVNKDDDLVLGIHMVGAEAGEIIQGLAVAMKMGLTKAVLDSTIGIHPTTAEEFVTLRTPITE